MCGKKHNTIFFWGLKHDEQKKITPHDSMQNRTRHEKRHKKTSPKMCQRERAHFKAN
jgi:hypothetical protein